MTYFGFFIMFVGNLHCLLTSLLVAFSRPVPAGLIRVRSRKPRSFINPTAALIAVVVPDLAGGIEYASRPTQCAAVDLRRRPPQ
jgi:hypothetical protein